MPCILCKNDAKVTERILLEDLSIKAKQFYEANNFVNWEFDYICTSCYRQDYFRRLRGNAIGLFLTVFLKFAMVYATSLAAWSFLVKYKYTGNTLFTVPVVFSVICTLFLHRVFFKIIMGVTFVVSASLILMYSAAYSDSVSFLPSMGAVVERQKMKQDGLKPVSSEQMAATTGTANAAGNKQRIDPVELAQRKQERERAERIKRYTKTLEEYTPFHLRFGLKELKENTPRALWGFACLYAILIPLHFVGMPIFRWWKERNSKRKLH